MEQGPNSFLFIINPNSGNRKLRDWESMISSYMGNSTYEILYTRYAGHSQSILAQYKDEPGLCIVAVGGDGTINDLLPGVLRSHSILGVVPTGSGNGLARHLGIPMNPAKAIQSLRHGKVHTLDLLDVNGSLCCNTSGIGFSATVARNFGKDGKRGFWSYLKLAFTLHRDSPLFTITINGQTFSDAWAVEIANSSQMGNNAVVSPIASVNDGIMDVLIMKKPKLWQIPGLMFMVFSKNILRSRLSHFLRATSLDVQLETEQDHHIDGDYRGMVKSLSVTMKASAIQIVS